MTYIKISSINPEQHTVITPYDAITGYITYIDACYRSNPSDLRTMKSFSQWLDTEI